MSVSNSQSKRFPETRFDPFKQQFGQFSIPGNLAVGDDFHAREKPSKKTADGKVITAPRNFLTKIPKQGQTNEALFSLPEYICDTYKDPTPIYIREKERAESMMQYHGKPWKSNGTYKEPLVGFEYQSIQADQKASKRDTDGKITLGPKGFFTSPPKKGAGAETPGLSIGKYPEYISNPYDSHEDWLKEQRIKEKSLRYEAPFRPSSVQGRNFTDSKTLYDYSKTLTTTGKQTTYTGISHGKPFMPFSSTLPGATIGKFPEHVTDPFPENERPLKKELAPWKSSNYAAKSWVSPAVNNMHRNLEKRKQ